MKKYILTLLLCLASISFSFGQTKISGNVYSDSTLTKPMSKVIILIKYNDHNKTYRTDNNGKFNIVSKFNMEKFKIEVKKKGYSSIILDINENRKDLFFDVILEKVFSAHDSIKYGKSKVIFKN